MRMLMFNPDVIAWCRPNDPRSYDHASELMIYLEVTVKWECKVRICSTANGNSLDNSTVAMISSPIDTLSTASSLTSIHQLRSECISGARLPHSSSSWMRLTRSAHCSNCPRIWPRAYPSMVAT